MESISLEGRRQCLTLLAESMLRRRVQFALQAAKQALSLGMTLPVCMLPNMAIGSEFQLERHHSAG